MATVTRPVVNTELGTIVTTGETPIIIDLGKKKKKKIKALKRGRGELMAEVTAVINEVRMDLGEEANNKQLVPVVLIYKEKRKRRRGRGSLFFPFLP